MHLKYKKILTRGINLHYFETHDCTTFQTKNFKGYRNYFSVLLLA